MWKDELALIPGVVTLIAPLAGTVLGFNVKVHGQDSWPGRSRLLPPPVPDRGPAWLAPPRRRRAPGSGGAVG